MKYVPNWNSEEELVKDDRFVAGLKTCARDIRDRAFYIKHDVMPNRDHAKVEVVEVDKRVYVVNTDHGGHLDEYGSVNNPPYAPLRTAVKAAGFRLDESE